MRAALSLFGLGLLLVTAGCGGEGGIGSIFEVTPTRATVAAGGTVPIHVTAVEIGVQSYSFTVQEGTAGGTLVVGTGGDAGTAIYTAPSTAGTYHVRAGFLESAGDTRLKTVTITVQ